MRPEDDTGPGGWAHIVDPIAMNDRGIKYNRMQVCRIGHVTAPYAFINIPDEAVADLMQGLKKCPHAVPAGEFGLCDLPTVMLLSHTELMAAYMLGGEDAITPLLRRYRKRYGL